MTLKNVQTLAIKMITRSMSGISSFGAKPEGEYLKILEKSPQYKNAKFTNTPITRNTMKMGMFSLFKEFFFHTRKPKSPLPTMTPTFLESIPQDQLEVTWLGHSTLIVEIEGKRLIIDPVFGAASPFPFLVTRLQPAPISFEDLPNFDAVLISHDHYDHLEMDTIKKFAKLGTKFYAPLGVSSHLKKWGVDPEKIHELDWWNEAQMESLKIVLTPARHFSGRGLNDRDATLWGSWTLIGTKQRFFFSGDSSYAEHFKEIGNKYGPFDLAAIENGAYDENWQDVHLFPEQSVQASIDLQAKKMLPVHWGMYDLALHSWFEPIKRAVAEGERLGVNVLTPQVGQRINTKEKSLLARWWTK